MVARRARNLWTGPLDLFRALRLVTDHTDPETVSGWTLTTIKANGCLRTFSVVWKRSLINQNLLWRHFWIKLFTSFWVKIWQNMSSTVSHKCPQSRFWFTRELFDTTLKVLRQPLAWVVVKVQPEACSGSVCSSPPPQKKRRRSVKHLFAEGRVRYLFAEGRVHYLFAEGCVRHGAFFQWPAFKKNEKSKCMPRRPKNQYVK